MSLIPWNKVSWKFYVVFLLAILLLALFLVFLK